MSRSRRPSRATLNYSHPGKGSTGHLGFELFKRLAGIDVTAHRLSRLSADGAGYRQRPDQLDLPVRQPGGGAGAERGDPDHRRDQRRPLEIFPRRADHGRAGLCRSPGDAVVRRRGAEGDAAAGRASRSARRWRRRWPRPTSSKSSTWPAARPRARRCRRSPISSRPTSRCGPRWSRRPASPPTEGEAARFRPSGVRVPIPAFTRLRAVGADRVSRRRRILSVSPLFGMFPTARNTSYIAPDWSPAPIP